MFRKALAFGSLAILGQSLSIQTGIHYDQCIVEDMAENGFSELVDWTNEHDNNMEIIQGRDSLDANITQLEVCFAYAHEDSLI